MLIEARIKITRELLGDRRTAEKVRRLTLQREGWVAVGLDHWAWALREAASALHLDVNSDCVLLRDGIRCPSVCLYNRTYTNPAGQREQEMFESIRKGAELSFNLVITGPAPHSDNSLPAPTVEQLRQMLQFVGEYIGISQWGNKFGYGRFDVIDLKSV